MMTSRARLLAVLGGEVPDRAVFAPNIWQWFEYQKLHGKLHPEIAHCRTQLEVLEALGVDIFSRNLLTDNLRSWIGGHAATSFENVEVEERTGEDGRRRITYHTSAGEIGEVLRFDAEGCTLLQDEYLFKDFRREFPAWKAWMASRRFAFDWDSFHALERRIGDRGLAIAGEITCPLKQLHWYARADQAIYLLYDHEREMVELMELYAAEALRLVREMVAGGVKVVMTMDNLDSFFYSPDQFERYCAGFYRQAAEICHEHGAWLFSHACGRQRQILPQVVACGIDGLEGIAFPPLGDIELWEARAAGPRFVVEGGLSAHQLEGEVSQAEADRYVRELFGRLRPFQRFIFSMSCNTSIATGWDTLRRYRDAWLKFGANCG